MKARQIFVAWLALALAACAVDVGTEGGDPMPAESAEPSPPTAPPPARPDPPPVDHGPTDPCAAGSSLRLVNGTEIWIPAECSPITPYVGDPAPFG